MHSSYALSAEDFAVERNGSSEPLGVMIAVADDEGLRLLEFADRRATAISRYWAAYCTAQIPVALETRLPQYALESAVPHMQPAYVHLHSDRTSRATMLILPTTISCGCW